jgi:hypothetical protein
MGAGFGLELLAVTVDAESAEVAGGLLSGFLASAILAANPYLIRRNSRRCRPVTVSPTSAAPGSLVLRPAPAGLPDDEPRPPAIATSGDPFTTVRVLQLVARIERGRPARVADLVAALNAHHLDWAFSSAVVADTLLQLQSNWMADYRNGSGIVIEEGPYGPTISLEDSSRVDPWIIRQVEREIRACQAALTDFSRRDGAGFDD